MRSAVCARSCPSCPLFVVAALFEIGGAWLVWQGIREHKGWIWIGAGVIALGILDEVGDVDGLGAARRDLVQFVGLDDDVLAFAQLEAFDDVFAGDLVTGVFVDPPVVDPVRGAALQLLEVDGVVLGRGEQVDRHADLL
jgi:hypothetical protein